MSTEKSAAIGCITCVVSRTIDCSVIVCFITYYSFYAQSFSQESQIQIHSISDVQIDTCLMAISGAVDKSVSRIFIVFCSNHFSVFGDRSRYGGGHLIDRIHDISCPVVSLIYPVDSDICVKETV